MTRGASGTPTTNVREAGLGVAEPDKIAKTNKCTDLNGRHKMGEWWLAKVGEQTGGHPTWSLLAEFCSIHSISCLHINCTFQGEAQPNRVCFDDKHQNQKQHGLAGRCTLFKVCTLQFPMFLRNIYPFIHSSICFTQLGQAFHSSPSKRLHSSLIRRRNALLLFLRLFRNEFLAAQSPASLEFAVLIACACFAAHCGQIHAVRKTSEWAGKQPTRCN